MAIKACYKLYDPQKKYITDSVKFLRDNTKQYILQEGPTGMGKTVGNLMAILYWINKKNHNAIYFSREHEQIKQCVEDLRELQNVNDVEIRAVHIAGRSMSCLRKEVIELENEEEQLITCEEYHNVICDYSELISRMERRSPITGSVYTIRPEFKQLYYEFDVNFGDTIVGSLNISTHLEQTSLDDLVDELFIDGLADNTRIMDVAEKYTICPRKLQELAMTHSNLIFAPYNYLVIPRIKFDHANKYLFLIDEAHNLDQNLTDMVSFQITRRTIENFLTITQQAPYNNDEAFMTSREVVFSPLVDYVFDGGELFTGDTLKTVLKRFDSRNIEVLESYVNMYVRRGIRRRVIRGQTENEESYQRLPRSFLTIQKFIVSLKKLKEQSTHGLMKVEDNRKLFIQFVNTKDIFHMATIPAVKTIISSGTLYPKHMQKYLGLTDTNSLLYNYEPPHTNLSNVGQIISSIDGVTLSTRYKDRGYKTYNAFAAVIAEIYEKNPDGTLVFFPSYSYRNAVGDILKHKYDIDYYEPKTVNQYRNKINNNESALFMSAFRGLGNEGWNFPNEQSRAIILCGIPYLPLGDPMVKAQMQYYDSLHRGLGSVWYKQKAILWMLQAFGRGIRHSKDWTKVYILDGSIQRLRRHFTKWVSKAFRWTPKKWSGPYGR